ncbi:MAG: ABC transporter permease [Planctomycetes bacterium]|nr:ABC transporter permease [Planctomycetota bacterium]MCB9891120.1 ABC transporter permease [Planctomycetota bacterium]MCB9918888.1 ABC transporter permease [Planctomycetota bacterium]
MNNIVHLMFKDLRLLVRDRFGLFWIFVFPLVYALFFGAIFSGQSGGGGGGKIGIAVVDQDESTSSKAFLELLAKHPSLSVRQNEDGSPRSMPLDAARDLVRRGKRAAYVALRKGFGDQGIDVFAPSRDVAQALVEVGVDPSRSAEKGYLQGILAESTFRHTIDGFADREKTKRDIARMSARVRDDPAIPAPQKLLLGVFFSALDRFLAGIDVSALASSTSDGASGESGMNLARIDLVDVTVEDEGPQSAFQITFPSAILWGLIGCASGFAIMIVRERTLGTMARLLTSPVTLSEILLGKGAACFVTCVAATLFLLLVAWIGLGIGLGSIPKLLVGVAASAFSFVGIMLVCSLLGKTEQAVAGATWGLMMPFVMLGGGMVPLIAMPSWMQQLSSVSPFKWCILALEGAIWRGFSWAEMVTPCLILVGVGVAGATVAFFLFRRTVARA